LTFKEHLGLAKDAAIPKRGQWNLTSGRFSPEMSRRSKALDKAIGAMEEANEVIKTKAGKPTHLILKKN